MADVRSIQNIIYNRLRVEGFSHTAALGVIANFAYETDNFKAFEEYSPNKYGTRGAGLAMWTDGVAPRRTMYEDWMRENNKDFNSIEDQLDYFMYELKNHPDNLPRGRNFSIEEMNKLDSVEAATDYFMKGFEAPQDQSNEHLQKRLGTIKDFQLNDTEEKFDVKAPVQYETIKDKDNIPQVIDPLSIKKNLDESLSVLSPNDKYNMDDGLDRVINGYIQFENQWTKAAHEMTDNAIQNDAVEYMPIEPISEPTTKEEPIRPSGMFADGGFLQPNGRITSFSRPEDIKAQNNTVNK